MSMVTYIGLNFTVTLNEYDTGDEVEIDYVFSDEEDRQLVQQKHFTTPYIYEIFERGNPIWGMNEYEKVHSPHNYEKSKKTFLHVCELLKKLLPEGDYCEMYICWLGEEAEECESIIEVNLKDLQIEGIDLYEKYFVRIENGRGDM